jgi:hypothetical protein
MKKLAVTIASILMSVYTYGQGTNGTLAFDTYVSGSAPQAIVINALTGLAAATDCSAQLFYSTASDGIYTALGTSQSFFGNTVDEGAGFIIGSDVSIAGKWAGDKVYVQMQAWRNADPTQIGTSAPLQVTLGGTQHDGSPDALAGSLAALQGFTIPIVPEPSTIALGLIGAAALLLRRRQ